MEIKLPKITIKYSINFQKLPIKVSIFTCFYPIFAKKSNKNGHRSYFWGTKGREFESPYPDHFFAQNHKNVSNLYKKASNGSDKYDLSSRCFSFLSGIFCEQKMRLLTSGMELPSLCSGSSSLRSSSNLPIPTIFFALIPRQKKHEA